MHIAINYSPSHLPPVIFGIKKEVCTNNSYANSHNAEDDQNQHHKAIYIVDLVCPERGKYEIPEKEKRKKKKGQVVL